MSQYLFAIAHTHTATEAAAAAANLQNKWNCTQLFSTFDMTISIPFIYLAVVGFLSFGVAKQSNPKWNDTLISTVTIFILLRHDISFVLIGRSGNVFPYSF